MAVTVLGHTTVLSQGGGPTTFSLDPPPTIAQLIHEVQDLPVAPPVKRILLATLTVARRAIERNLRAPARATLRAFAMEVTAVKRRGLLPAAVAAALIADAQAIATAL